MIRMMCYIMVDQEGEREGGGGREGEREVIIAIIFMCKCTR